MIHLLDGNVLVALVVEDHVHHDVARRWFGASRPFATCPMTQGTLLRLLLREGAAPDQAQSALAALTGHPDHQFWPDDASFLDVDLRPVTGHRQVTDAYLAHLARGRSARVATLDRGFLALHPDVADGIEPGQT